MMLATEVNWSQVLANVLAFTFIAAFLGAILAWVMRGIIDARVKPAIKEVTDQQAQALEKVLDTLQSIKAETTDNSKRIAYLEGLDAGQQRALDRDLKG